MQAFDADFFATGHYAKIVQEDKAYFLAKGTDLTKDQSYFLYRIPKDVLEHTLFPLGEFHKEEIKEKARLLHLEVSKKKESQDLCIGDYKSQLSLFIQEGKIKDRYGKILGRHQGYWRFTIGQRKGLGVASSTPLYVTQIYPLLNEVILGPEEDLLCTTIELQSCKIFKPLPKEITFKYRSSMPCITGKIITYSEDKITLESTHPIKRPGNGQSCVIYLDDKVIGGGIITNAL